MVYVHKAGVSPLEDSREVHYAAPLTTSIVPMQDEEQRDMQKVKYSAYLQFPHVFFTTFIVDSRW